jgi:hypothetical protein
MTMVKLQQTGTPRGRVGVWKNVTSFHFCATFAAFRMGDQRSISCVYRKLKPGRSGDEVRQGLGVNRCFRSAEQGERPEHLCPMTGVF